MNPADPDSKSQRFSLTFLTDQWEWDERLTAATMEQARTLARVALEALVRDEKPELACVYLLDEGVRIGAWDWVERQPYWTPL